MTVGSVVLRQTGLVALAFVRDLKEGERIALGQGS